MNFLKKPIKTTEQVSVNLINSLILKLEMKSEGM